MKIYNSATLTEERKEVAKKVNSVLAFKGDRKANYHCKDHRQLAERFNVTENSDDLEALRYRVMNVAKSPEEATRIVRNAESAPGYAEIDAFFGKFFLDVTRRALEAPDLTSLIAREETNLDFAEVINLRDVLKFRGEMSTISGENDAVPLIEQHTGNVDTLSLAIKAVGWKDSLANMLWNRFMTMDKVVQAAVDADVDARNAAIIGAIVAATFVASQKQAADGTASQTLDEHTYNTFVNAIKLLRGLKDVQTGKKILVPSISILCNSADTWQIENVIRGQLNGNGSSARASNRPGLPIANVIEYDGGINNGVVLGKKTLSYPGVTAGKCYIFVPGVALVANKRPLTMETGMGSVLELSTEERAWYRVQGTYLKDLLGSSHNPAAGGAAGFGAIVEVTLPTT
jgi:hypothetical protein